MKKIIFILQVMLSGCALDHLQARNLANDDLCRAAYNGFYNKEGQDNALYEIHYRRIDCSTYMQADNNRTNALIGAGNYFNNQAVQNQRIYQQNKPTNCIYNQLGQSIISSCQ